MFYLVLMFCTNGGIGPTNACIEVTMPGLPYESEATCDANGALFMGKKMETFLLTAGQSRQREAAQSAR